MVTIDPTSTTDGFLRDVAPLRDQGFSAAYVFAKDITEPSKITDLLGAAVPKLAG